MNTASVGDPVPYGLRVYHVGYTICPHGYDAQYCGACHPFPQPFRLPRTAVKCPVCEGSGTKGTGFDNGPGVCHGCDGKGWVAV